MKKTLYIIALLVGLAVAGCVVTTGVDPNTGAAIKTYAVDTNITDKAEAAATIGVMVAPFFGPVGGLIAGVLAGALGAWRKVKPSLTEAKTLAAQSHAATAAVVTACEGFKETNPGEWAALSSMIKAQMGKQGIDPKVIENVIRAIRGLPAKA